MIDTQNKYKNTEKIVVDVPLFVRLMEYAKENVQTDEDILQVADNALELLHIGGGQVLTIGQYDQLVGETELNENKKMKKKLTEVKRMQQLAGILNEEQGYEDERGYGQHNDYGHQDEDLDEDLDEMARNAGSGGSYSITPEGIEALKQTKSTGTAPEGLRTSHLGVLVFLYKAQKENKRVQKVDYAKEKGKEQAAVNPLFNQLEEKGLIAKEGYESKPKEPVKNPRPKVDVKDLVGDIEVD